MTAPTQDQVVEQKPSDKEMNFRQLEAKYQRQLEQERNGRLEAERRAEEASRRQEPDEDDSEPYIDHKKLEKKLAKFGEQSEKKTQNEIQKAVHVALEEERKTNWLKQNSDFYDVLAHAEKLANSDPELAETILKMPDNFDRQKLVYKTIKAQGIHKPPVPQPTIQDKINSNRRGSFYQPTGVGAAPYSSQGDFSATGMKDAYTKMKELQARTRF